MYKKLTIYSDGGARGNPGPGGIGVVIKHGEQVIESFGRFIGVATNNQAEYKALIAGLERAGEFGAQDVQCILDSELVVRQMRHEYKVRDKDLQPLFLSAWNLSTAFKHISYTHVPREQNALADKLLNEALDRHLQ